MWGVNHGLNPGFGVLMWDVVAERGCGGSYLGCGGSVGYGNWVNPDKGHSCPGFESGSPHSLLNGARKYVCVSLNKSLYVRRLCLSKKQLLKKHLEARVNHSGLNQGPHLRTPNPRFNPGFTPHICYTKRGRTPSLKPLGLASWDVGSATKKTFRGPSESFLFESGPSSQDAKPQV
jgi:hypothetical protein